MKRLAVFVVGLAVLGAGIPVLWMWIASKAENERPGVSMVAAVIMVSGLLISYALVALGADAYDQRHNPARQKRRVEAWNRSLSSDRAERSVLSDTERVFVAITLAVVAAFEVWFIFFSGSSLPVGT